MWTTIFVYIGSISDVLLINCLNIFGFDFWAEIKHNFSKMLIINEEGEYGIIAVIAKVIIRHNEINP